MKDGLPEVPVASGNLRYERVVPRPPADGAVDLQAALPGEGPLELDIGFGRGASLFSRAEAAPESRIIGVEIKAKWAYKVEARRLRLEMDQIRAWCADVRGMLTRATPEACLQRVFVHFPDPWWKKRHAKRRVIESALLDDLARLMVDGGDLYVQTDVLDRAELYAATIDAHASFEREPEWLKENPFGGVSNRESRAAEDGLPVYRILSKRIAR